MSAEFPFKNGQDQFNGLPPRCPDLHNVTVNLHRDILSTLAAANIPIITSEFRTKTEKRIASKIDKSPWPLTDIHGVRVVLEEEHIEDAVDNISSQWSTPEYLFWGAASVQTPTFKTSTHFDDLSRLMYEATHMRIYIPEGARIAEIQLQTPEQHVISGILWPRYEQEREGRT